MQLSAATWPEIRDCEGDLAVLPIGSTEQHGPHAPLGTDALAAAAVAEAGVKTYRERTGADVPVAPTIPVGIAAEHRAFDGTLWVSPDTFRAYVRETVASLAHHGFDRVVIVNGHGGNTDALREITGTISREDDAYAVAFTWFDSIDTEQEMGHGGPVETSLLYHIDDDAIREAELETARDGASEGWGEWVAGVNLAHDSAEFTDSGVVGDPTEATAELGERLLDRSGEALADLLVAVESRNR
ncbi:creatininase family protein [Halonotius terrestris]|uniref:Creatininase family protein n=1 Tax=Halonotius terrestris TaxID=2487750 RepID=A0A8J8PC22_9EURY|nr:creatininase family protein [Halonotius terrestris]TQQ81333.1 creatininase family protein [Halonotius terrestris]